jgi:choline-glycine betaine transporter
MWCAVEQVLNTLEPFVQDERGNVVPRIVLMRVVAVILIVVIATIFSPQIMRALFSAMEPWIIHTDTF